jgi:hypothetical protein
VPSCQHEKYGARVKLAEITGKSERLAEIQLYCSQCGGAFRFIGVEMGMGLDTIHCSLDRTQLRIPLEAPDTEVELGEMEVERPKRLN